MVRLIHRRRYRLRPVLVAAAVSLVLSACRAEPSAGIERLDAAFPDLRLGVTDESGAHLEPERLEGQIVLLYFGYTHCPDACPTTLARLRDALGRLPNDVSDTVKVVFVSVDPKRDDPADLARYTQQFGRHFVGASASRQRLRRLTHRLGTDFGYGDNYPEPPYTVTHPDTVFVFDRAGRARLMVRSSAMPAAIAHELRELAERTS